MTLDPEEQPTQGPVVRDKRRIDPETGEVRQRPQTDAAAPVGPGTPPRTGPAGDDGTAAEPGAAEVQLAERTADLQRLQAEYLNYKRRVDRERENARASAIATTLGALLPVLDDIARAREHEELTGGFKAVAESLERTVTKLGLTPFGTVGDPFDPRIHEALMHSYSDDVDEPVCQAILQVGYQIGERIVRPARVAVAEPPSAPAEPTDASTPAGDEWFGASDEAADEPSYGNNGDDIATGGDGGDQAGPQG